MFIVDSERLVVALFESDRGGRLSAQTASANGSGKRPWQYLQIIRQRLEPLGAAEVIASAALGAGRKLRAPEAADHECVSGEHEPRLLGAGPVGDHKRDVLRRVAGGVQ